MPDILNHTDLPDSFKFPFKKDCIDLVNIQMMKSASTGKFMFFAVVSYRNGKTSGRQEFNGRDLKDLLIQIETFIQKMG